VTEGERVEIEGGISLHVLYTPGHTDDSYRFLFNDRVFTGDTLLIRGTGRTDFQNGDPVAQYGSLFDKLPKLPEDTLVYPGHDYKGDTVSTIAEERAFNPRLQVASLDEYVDIMNNLNLDNPKMMDVAVLANLKIGMSQESVEARGWGLSCEELQCSIDSGEELILVDLRESTEQRRHGVIPDSVHAPYPNTETNVAAGGLLRELTGSTGRRHVSRLTYRPRSEYSSGTERVTPKGSSMSTDENKAAKRRYLEAFNQRKRETLDQFFTSTTCCTSPARRTSEASMR
jgi:hypothetical protein